MKQTLLTMVWLLLPLSVFSQTTLEECQKLAQDNYPLIRRYGLIEETEQFTLSNLEKGWLPQISASAQATYQNRVVEFPDALKTMMQQMGTDIKGLKKDQYKVMVDVNQMVYDGGAISAQKNIAKAQTQVQKAQNEVDLYALNDRVNNLFFSLLLVEKRMEMNKQTQQLLQANEDKLQTMLKNGVVMESDRDAVRAERLTAVQQYTQLESQRSTLLQVLSLFCGKEIAEIQEPSEVPTASSTASGRPELSLFDRQIELTRQQENALKSGLLPKLSVFAQGYYGYPGYNMYADMFSHNWSFNAMIGARLTWNIGSLYTRKNDKAKLANQRQQIENARETFLFNNQLQNKQEDGQIAAYRKMLQEDTEIINLRSGVRKAAESKLEHGIVDVTNLIQEITREDQARTNRSTHQVEMLQHIYNKKVITNE